MDTIPQLKHYLYLKLVHCTVFSHIRRTGFNPDCIVYDPIHDGICMNSTTKTSMPVFLVVLGTKDGWRGIMPPFYQFKQEMLLIFRYVF